MKRRLIAVTALFAFIICAVTLIFYLGEKKQDNQDIRREQLVALNEIEQLAKSGELETFSRQAAVLRESIKMSSERTSFLWYLCGVSVLLLSAVFGYAYFFILRPFEKMRRFAGHIARGDFDIPLDYERSNYFGEFTWAFDSMRREITKARACEKEAVDNNKTVIATLSHDIKTPIASIRAYAEGLEANLDATPEKRAKYLGILMKKCDEVSKLTEDLFLHSLADLDKLKITPENVELGGFMERTVSDIAGERNDIEFVVPDFEAWVSADKKRLTQLAENLINNARKYAKSGISIYITENDGSAELHFRDFGGGIPDEDMPFIFDKFYRGRNCGEEQGSGLGLYIVRYITLQMNGNVLLHNHADGLEAIISFPMIQQGS